MAYLEELGLALTGGAGLIVLAGIFRDYHYGNEGEDEADGQHQHIWFPQPVGVSHIILLTETKALRTAMPALRQCPSPASRRAGAQHGPDYPSLTDRCILLGECGKPFLQKTLSPGQIGGSCFSHNII